MPEPHHHLLYDVTVYDDEVSHQHVDLSYYALSRVIEPRDGERTPGAWN